MHDFIVAEDSEVWDVICDGPFIPMKTIGEPAMTIPKIRKEYNHTNRKSIDKNFQAKNDPRLWMKDDESIQVMHTRFTSIINELHSLGEIIPRNKLVRKILTVLPGSWESKVNAITEAKDLQKLTIDELIGNLKTYEMKKKKDHERREPKREKNLVLKTDNNDSSGEDADMAYLTKRFQKMVHRNGDEDEEDDNDDENVLTVELGEIEHERDDLVVVVADLKETIESLKGEKDTLTERIANIEHERDDLLVVVVDLKETIEELRRESRHENTQKGKEVASEAHLRLENELKSLKSSLCVELQKNRQLQEDLGSVKNDLEKSLKWTCSSDAITTMFKNNGGIGSESDSKGKKLPTTHIGAMKGSNQRWYMYSGCSKHMTGSTNNFLSLKALQGGSVSFGNGKKGYILGVGRIEKSLTHSIENVYCVNGLKYNLLSVSQICDKGNKVESMSKIYIVTNLVTGEVILMAKRYKNIYVADFES
ncbi:PREDICTED: uncharacterized protein LOC109232504 [Nicotiana attenuata]|uniref:uncharacterized protein LOC109232504 n=1 Tax=Nicotiana attenuata TaxID=49451 RepID=UPI00090521CF|nr:PREDICTED: uncharacterized protein LOC109232504 [Nicotiana attenuata]